MKTTESRVSALEQSLGLRCTPPGTVICFVRAPGRFVCGYQRVTTGESIDQADNEADADFVARAKAAGFIGGEHEHA